MVKSHPLKFLFLFLFLSTLIGCAEFQKPDTIRQRIAYAEATLTASYQTVADLKRAGSITSESRDKLVADLDQAGFALDASTAALQNGLPDDALGRLRLAESILRAVQVTLKEMGK